MPEPLRGHNTNSHTIRHDTNLDNNSCDTNVHSPIESKSQDVNSSVNNTPIETDLVHLGRRPQDECSLFIQTGKRSHKALWDSGAGQCVLSFDCYNAIPAKYKTDLFTSPIKIRAANGTLIENKGECDITFKIGPIRFTFPFLCSAQLSQEFILGYNFSKAFHIGTTWSADDTMSLTHQGKMIAQTISTKEINSIVFCCESTVIPPFSNAKIKCRAPKVRSRANSGQNLLFEPSNRHKSNYVNCNTYNGLVTFDEHTAGSGSFDIVMTNTSNQHVKVTKNQTLGMLKSCDQDQICTVHKLVMLEPNTLGGEGITPKQTKQTHDHSIESETVTKDFYQIPTRNKHGEIEVLTVLKDNISTVNKITDTALDEFVSHKKPELQDAPIDQKTKLDLEQLLEKNKDAFAEDERQIGTTPLITMSIDTGDQPPIAKIPYTLALKHHDWVRAEIDKLLEAGVIRESDSSWSAPIVVVPKSDGGKRLCIDYRALNQITRTYIWPMPRIEDILAKLGKAKFFTTLDLRSGYHHIALDKHSIKKTAFCTPFGKYEYLKVPFGLAQAPSYFQKLMNKVLNGLNFAFAYLDDIIIFSTTAEEHMRHIQIVIDRLKAAQLKLKKSKCAFFKKELYYLGHLLTTEGIKPQFEKVKAIHEMKPPSNPKGIREFLGMVGFYRKFINRFADAARPITKLTRKDSKYIWTEECQTGFEYLRTSLTKSPILKYPDPHKRYVVFTDASDQAAAAVLTQEYSDDDGQVKEMPIAYLSAQFNDTQFKWSTVVKEGYAIYYAMKKWRHYLEDAEILLKSDAKSLQKFLNGRTDNLKLDRWSLELQGRNIQVEHIPGYKNKAADCLSRLPFVTRKRNDNPLKDEDISVNAVQPEDDTCCPLCEVDLTDTKTLQQEDKHCIRISKLIADPKSRFHERDSYGYDDKGILYHINRENGREYKATVVPRVLVKTVLKEMHDHFGHFGIGKTYSLIKRYYYWPKMIKHIQSHVDSCTLCRREKMQADKYQLQTTEIPNRAFGKVSIDLIVDLPVSHNGNKNILVMVDQLTSWPIATAIPDKEATTVANAIHKDLILQHGAPEILLSDNGKEFCNDTLAYVCQEYGIAQHFTSPYTPRSNGKTENFNKFLKASIRKLCQADNAAWDQVLDQILFSYRCCPHTSTGEAPYTLLYFRDPPIPIHKLIQPMESYKGDNSLGKQIEQSRVTLSIAAKMLERMRENQKRHYKNRKSTHTFKIGDLVLLKKHNKEKLELKWEPNYRIIKFPSLWSAIVEDQSNGRTKRCNIADLKIKHPSEDWELKPGTVGRAARFVNHPENLPDIDFIPDKIHTPDKNNIKPNKTDDIVDASHHKYSLRKSIKAPTKLDL